MCNPALKAKINSLHIIYNFVSFFSDPFLYNIYLLILQNNYLFFFMPQIMHTTPTLIFYVPPIFPCHESDVLKTNISIQKLNICSCEEIWLTEEDKLLTVQVIAIHRQGENLECNIVVTPFEMILNCWHTSWNEW